MKYFKVKFNDGTQEIVPARDFKSVVNKHEHDHSGTRIIELQGEQLAIAISEEESDE